MIYRHILSFVAGVLTTAILVLALDEPMPEAVVVEPTENTNFAAISFFDCDELIRVVFLTSFGRAEAVKIDGAARLLDVQLRLSDIPYERAYFVVNERPCGFRMDDEEKT